MDYSAKSQNIISFCSGYGGIELGFDLAGMRHRVVAYVEREAYAVANLVAKMEEGKLVPAPVWTNLKTFQVEKFRGRVHGITAGYPCQPFSAAGQRKGTDDPRHLWPYIREAVRVIQPRWCFFENVEGHISLGLSTVISDLEEDGYRTTWGIFSASEVGAPHQRKRVFILAKSKSRKSWEQTERKRREDTGGGSEEELAHSRCVGQAVIKQQTTGIEQSGELADTEKQGLERLDKEQKNEIGFGLLGGENITWPSRPGEPQHEWEEPRTCEVYSGPKPTKWHDYQKAIKSLICGTPYGRSYAMDAIANRVDRLRLCGNGVVPQTATKAWIVLNNRFPTGAW